MNYKSMIFIVFAVAIGYLMISTVPEQVAMYTSPRIITETGADMEQPPMFGIPDNRTVQEPDILEDSSETPGSGASEAAKEAGAGASNIFNLTSWWVIDFLIAFVVYWVAKRRIF